MAFGHNELWRPEAANKVSVTTQMLWPLATTNCGGRKPQKWLLSWLKYRQMATLLVAQAPAAWKSSDLPLVPTSRITTDDIVM